MNFLLPPVDVAYVIFALLRVLFYDYFFTILSKFASPLTSSKHVDLHETIRTFILRFIFMIMQTQNLNILPSKTYKTSTSFLTMKDDDSQKLVADINDRTHRDLSIHVSQRLLFYFLVFQKLTQSLYVILLCFKCSTLTQFFTIKNTSGIIFDNSMSFSIKNHA